MVSGANLLTKDGTGSVVLSGANTNTGGVTLNNGTLALGSTTAMGTVAGNLTLNGGSLDSTVASLTMGNAKPTTINGDFAYTGSGGNSLNLSTGVVGLGTSAGTTRTITVNAGTLTLGGIISNGTTANSITKSGAGTLVLSGVNTHTGLMSVTSGTLQIAATTGLGSGAATNTIALSGGGRLLATATTDLTANRSIAVGTGGGVLAFSNASAGTLTVPGAITGSDALTFQNAAAGAGTFALTGNNTGLTGAVSAGALSTGGVVVTLAGQTSLPAAPSITLNHPANATASGTATTLSFPAGVNFPAATTLNFTSAQPTSALSLRSGLAITGASGTSAIDSPLRLSGSSVVQFNAATGTTVNYTGGLAETAPGSYAEAPGVPNSNVVFFRGAGTHNYNTAAINLPSTGARIAVTDGAVFNLNTTGNTFASAASLFGPSPGHRRWTRPGAWPHTCKAWASNPATAWH